MDQAQTLINVGVGVFSLLAGWLFRVMWESIAELRQSIADGQLRDQRITDKVAALEVVVAGQYVKRDDMDRTVGALFAKLDRIEDKLDKKVDKNAN